jgi:hypothetical protein
VGYFANGTEAMMFEEAWCSRCKHSDCSPGKELGVDPPCPVWMAHTLYSYELCNEEEHPGKVILDALIPIKTVKASDGFDVQVNECAMFTPIDSGAAIPGQARLEL